MDMEFTDNVVEDIFLLSLKHEAGGVVCVRGGAGLYMSLLPGSQFVAITIP